MAPTIEPAPMPASVDPTEARSSAAGDATKAAEAEASRAVALAEWKRQATEASASETRSGRCDPRRHAALEQRVYAAKRVRNPLVAGHELILKANWIIVADAEGSRGTFESLSGGEIDVLVLGYEAPQLRVLNGQGDEVLLRSPFAGPYSGFPDFPDETTAVNLRAAGAALSPRMMETLENIRRTQGEAAYRNARGSAERGSVSPLTESRVVQTNVGERLTIFVRGAGCALVAVYKLY